MKNESSFLPRPEHPEPMMRRDSWQNLNGEWLFAFDYSLSGRERGLFLPEQPRFRRLKNLLPSYRTFYL